MIIYDFDFMGVLTHPTKAEAPLVIDANAVLASALAFESFQAIAGRKAQDVESVGGIELEELSAGSALNVGWQVTRSGAGKEILCFGAGEASDHDTGRRRGGGGRKRNSYAGRNGLWWVGKPRILCPATLPLALPHRPR
jgi:hypothetical protein